MIHAPNDHAPNRDGLVLIFATALVAVSLALPRPMNFAPLGAFGLFVGAYALSRRSWVYPVGALAVYVVSLGGYNWLVMAGVFLGFSGPAVIGAKWLKGQVSVGRVGVSALASSVWFFVVSNFGSWIAFGIPSGQTIGHHYLLGIPFFRNTLAGDLFFSAVLFGGYALVQNASLRRARGEITT